MTELDIEIAKIFNEYSIEVKSTLEKIANEVASSTVRELKESSPKKKGEYAKSWAKKTVENRLGKSVVVFNKNGSLTHLLEFGHVKRGGRGRTRAFPHIGPAEQNAVKNFEKKVREKLGK